MSDPAINHLPIDGTPQEFLFLDNFRGFKNTLIPLRDVTFLVGENSTGKSSVMSVLHLIRSYSFWQEPDFDTEDQHLGGFNDLISAGAKDSDAFVIGTARYAPTFTGKSQAFVVFGTFTNREGLPHISKLSFVGKLGLLTVIEHNGEILYSHEQVSLIDGNPIMNSAWVSDIAKRHQAATHKNGTKISFDSEASLSGLPLFHLIGLAELRLRKERAEKSSETDDAYLSSIYNFMGPTDSTVWLAPIRSKPRRTYDGTKKAFSAEGDHTPYLLKKELLGNKGKTTRFKKLIGQLGKNSHLFHDLRIKSFGSGEGSPFEVQINLGGVHLGLSNVGYGVSQVLPILAEIVTRANACVFHIQQPEVHLHPRAQASLGDLFYVLAKDDNKHFVIETHSDYLIDRYRAAMRDNNDQASHSNTSVVFFSRSKGENKICELLLTGDGSYPLDQPSEFREFFVHEQIRNLGI